MEIENRQEFRAARRHPSLRRAPLTLRTVTVAAGIIGDARIGAVLASLDVTRRWARLRWASLASCCANPTPAIHYMRGRDVVEVLTKCRVQHLWRGDVRFVAAGGLRQQGDWFGTCPRRGLSGQTPRQLAIGNA